MRYKEPYTLYKRKMKNGKYVYYYRYYDENGKRTVTNRNTDPSEIGKLTPLMYNIK